MKSNPETLQARIDELEATLEIVALGIWRDKARNACGLAGDAMTVHAVEFALRRKPAKARRTKAKPR